MKPTLSRYGPAPILKNFAVLEGGDGTGTTTQLALLQRRFSQVPELTRRAPEESGSARVLPPLYITQEPTGGKVGLLIRSILKGESFVEKETLARLFAADRGEHLYGPGGIVERCERGELVVSDRYTPSSLVYQGIDCGEELPRLLNDAFPRPELLVYLDLDSKTAMERVGRRETREIYERLEYQEQVRQAYKALLPRYESAGVRIAFIDGSPGPEEVAEEVWRALSKMPIMNQECT